MIPKFFYVASISIIFSILGSSMKTITLSNDPKQATINYFEILRISILVNIVLSIILEMFFEKPLRSCIRRCLGEEKKKKKENNDDAKDLEKLEVVNVNSTSYTYNKKWNQEGGFNTSIPYMTS